MEYLYILFFIYLLQEYHIYGSHIIKKTIHDNTLFSIIINCYFSQFIGKYL